MKRFPGIICLYALIVLTASVSFGSSTEDVSKWDKAGAQVKEASQAVGEATEESTRQAVEEAKQKYEEAVEAAKKKYDEEEEKARAQIHEVTAPEDETRAAEDAPEKPAE